MTDFRGDHPAPAESADRDIVVVPRMSGPIISVEDRPGRQPDDLDALIDDVFGPPTNERPGRFDLALIVVGSILLIWALTSGGSNLLVIVAGVTLVLGLVLPARSVARAFGRRREAARRHRLIGTGVPLDVSSASTAALVAAYADLREAAVRPGVARATDAIDAGHFAVLEAASLLAGRPPIVPAQVAYVERRTLAIHGLTHELTRMNQAWLDVRGSEIGPASLDQQRRAEAMTRAREELESERLGSLDQIETLTGRLRRYADGRE